LTALHLLCAAVAVGLSVRLLTGRFVSLSGCFLRRRRALSCHFARSAVVRVHQFGEHHGRTWFPDAEFYLPMFSGKSAHGLESASKLETVVSRSGLGILIRMDCRLARPYVIILPPPVVHPCCTHHLVAPQPLNACLRSSRFRSPDVTAVTRLQFTHSAPVLRTALGSETQQPTALNIVPSLCCPSLAY
jgi:hypothetical protein